MPRHPNSALREFLLRSIPQHPKDIATVAVDKFGLTRQVVNRALKSLTDEGLVVPSGKTSGRRYVLAVKRDQATFPLEAAEEHLIWSEWVAPQLEGINRNIWDICQYAVTEMVNNAIDHSEGSWVVITVERTAVSVQIMIQDDGVGLFEKIKSSFHLEDDQHAALELVKGKLTTDPARHSGEGIFFTSRAVDHFVTLSSRVYFSHTSKDEDWLIETSDRIPGTLINLTIDAFTSRTLREVFDRFTSDHDNYSFNVTHVPVDLAVVGEHNLISRSQAKRLTARFNRFERVVLDFAGVHKVGQAFADEVFRVYALQHPAVDIVPIRAEPEVMTMIKRAIAARDETAGFSV